MTALPADLGLGEESTLVENRKVSQSDLHKYAWASGDYNPIHYNAKIAEQMGLPGVIAHGMLSLAFLNRAMEALALRLSQESGQALRVTAIDTRFSGMLQVDDTISVSVKFHRSLGADAFGLNVWAFKNGHREQVVCSAVVTLTVRAGS